MRDNNGTVIQAYALKIVFRLLFESHRGSWLRSLAPARPISNGFDLNVSPELFN